MSGVSGNLVPQALGGNDRDLIADPLVGLEVQRQLGVVTLNDDLGGLLDGLGTDTTHDGDFCGGLEGKVVLGRGGGCRVSSVVAEEWEVRIRHSRLLCVVGRARARAIQAGATLSRAESR